MEVNFIIDYSKTLYKPERPKWANDIIVKYTKEKIPYFFQYAKKKKRKQVKDVTECTVDRIKKLYPKRKLNFNFKIDNIGKFDYKVLMCNPDTDFKQDIADKFKDVTSNLNFNNVSDEKMYSYLATYENAKNEILSLNYTPDEIVDSVIVDLFANRKTPMKKAFWTLFGDIVYQNICKNIDDSFVQCERCHKRFYRKRKDQIYCDKCIGYHKQNIKKVICRECGTEFEVESNSRRIRCDFCYKIERQRIEREKKRKQRKM